MKKSKPYRPGLFQKITSFLLTAAVIVLAVALIYTAAVNLFCKDRILMLFGHGFAVVISGSMEPAIQIDDLVLIAQKESYSPGDVVVYLRDGRWIIHRVIQVREDTLITQGDANNLADPPVPLAAVKGYMILRIPQGGKVVNFIKTPAVTAVLLAAAAGMLLLSFRKEANEDGPPQQD